MARWSAVVPIGRETFDGRKIVALRVIGHERLTLMQVRDYGGLGFDGGAMPVGSVLWIDVERRVVRFGGTINDSALQGAHWFAAPDLAATSSLSYHHLFRRRAYVAMTGELVGITLVPEPSWRRQQPVEFLP